MPVYHKLRRWVLIIVSASPHQKEAASQALAFTAVSHYGRASRVLNSCPFSASGMPSEALDYGLGQGSLVMPSVKACPFRYDIGILPQDALL